MGEHQEGPVQALPCLALCCSQSNLVPMAELWGLRADEKRKEGHTHPSHMVDG